MKIDRDYLLDALCLFEKSRGIKDEFIEYRLSDSPLVNEPIESVALTVSRFIEEAMESSDELLPVAVFALGKSNSEDYRELYLDVMKKAQLSNPQASYQAAVSYENLGNQVFNGSADSSDEAAFLKSINDYLVANAV